MNASHDPRDEPSTESQFHAQLAELIRSAHDNDVDVSGGWDLRNDERYPDWSLEIVELRKRSQSRRDEGV
jgi:hypothetical protein